MRRKLRILFLIACLGPVWVYGQHDNRLKGRQGKSPTKEKSEKKRSPAPINYKELGSPLPELVMLSRHGDSLRPFEQAGSGPYLVFMFNPTCDHCQQIAREIKKEELDRLGNRPIVWLASSQMPPGHLEFFHQVTKIEETQMQMGLDLSGFIDRTFVYGGLPQLNIYNEDQILVRQYPGEIPLDSLASFITEKEALNPEHSKDTQENNLEK